MGLVFKLMAALALDSAAYNRGLDDAETRAKGFGSKLASGLGTAVGAVGAAMAAGAAAVAGLTKQAVESYANYEQLVGGVETLFKESSKEVMAYADIAFKTAGLSANQYMETVTGFSASLLQSLGGDTAKAAKTANRAIKDMSDNANKMGTNMASISAAYQGFAKQNYTLLDNLKLGYGGTKTEMERLVQEAAALTDVQEELGVTVDANSLAFANIVDAISVVQRKMGIMGTTAKEAAQTVSGSAGAMRAAWQNLVTGVANDQADFGQLVDDLVESVGAAAENVLPRVEIALGGVGRLVEGLAPVIAEHLPSLADKVLPGLVGAATGLVNSLVGQLPTLADTGVKLFGTLLDNGPSIITNLTGKLPEIITGLTNALTDPDKDLIGKMVDAGVELFKGLAKDAPAIIEALAEATPKIINGIAEALLEPDNVVTMVEGGVNLFLGLVDNIPRIVEALGEGVMSIVNGIANVFSSEEARARMALAFLKLIDNPIIAGVLNMVPGGGAMVNAINAQKETLRETLSAAVDELAEHTRGRVREVTGEAAQESMRGRGRLVGEAFSEGVGVGFEADMAGVHKDIIAEFKLIVDDVNDEMGIHSPSTVFKRIGGFMADGVGVGFENRIPEIRKGIIRRMREIVGAVQNEMQISSPSKVFAQIGKFMAQGIGVGWDSEIGNVNGLIAQSINPDFAPVSTIHRGGNTYNIYAQKMTPAEVFEESVRVERDREFLGIGGSNVSAFA